MNRRSLLQALASLALAPLPEVQRPRRPVPSPAASIDARRGVPLRPVRALPVEIVGNFRDPIAFEQSAAGQYFVFDRLGHTVYGVDAQMQGAWKIVSIGQEAGRILEPTAFAVSPNGSFVVADRPGALERLQFFGIGGSLIGGFTLPGRASETIVFGSLVLNGIGSLQYDGRTVFLSQPETGSLVTEYSPAGVPLRTFGMPRATGFESDRDVHLALNSGIPVFNPQGGFYFVFQTGIPIFRKYDDRGKLLFERHIEGTEIDELLQSMPTRWPTRRSGDREVPMVPPVVRTARADARGNLWVAFAAVPCTYVFDPSGEKVRVVQFRAGGILTPSSLFFSHTGRLLVTPGCYEFETRTVQG